MVDVGTVALGTVVALVVVDDGVVLGAGVVTVVPDIVPCVVTVLLVPLDVPVVGAELGGFRFVSSADDRLARVVHASVVALTIKNL